MELRKDLQWELGTVTVGRNSMNVSTGELLTPEELERRKQAME